MTSHRVLVTGGSRGIGNAIVHVYKTKGFEVIAPSRSELDLSDEKSIHNFTNEYQGNNFDVLINNAAENIISPIIDLPLSDWKFMQTINLTAPFLLTKFVLPHMISQKWGRIVNISSAYSAISRNGRAGYASTKAGLSSLTRTSALEAAPHNVLVNAVAPGFVETDLTRKNNTTEQMEALKKQIPLGRLGTATEIAEFVFHLGSENNTYVTGQTVFIDGGFMAQ